MVILPDNTKVENSVLVEDLKKDNIYIRDVDRDKMKQLESYFDSFIKQHIVASRYSNIDEYKKYLSTKLSHLIDKNFIEKHLIDVTKSTNIIREAISKNETIAIVTDYDVDGVTSAAIAYKFFTNLLNYNNIRVIVNKRSYGYGFNLTLADKIIDISKNSKIGVVITADHGSKDRKTVQYLKERIPDIKIIITDHHLISEDYAPYNADAFINPKRTPNSDFYEITGATVLYFTLLHFYLSIYSRKSDYLYYLLLYCGLTVLSDSADLRSYVNRKIVKKMLSDLNNSNVKHDVFWSKIREYGPKNYIIDETYINFNVVAPLNSPGRIRDPILSYNVLTAKDEYTFDLYYKRLTEVNDKRKSLQKILQESEDKIEYTDGITKVMVIDDSEGIQGIIAGSNIFNDNYKVVICFAKRYENRKPILIGSGRCSDETISMVDLIKEIKNNHKDVILEFGGHSKAIGISIENKPKEFYKLLSSYVKKYLGKDKRKVYVDDYVFSTKKFLIYIFSVIELAPYGVGFESPLFVSDFYIEGYRIVKSRKAVVLTMKVRLPESKMVVNVLDIIPSNKLDEISKSLKRHKYVRLVYEIKLDTYRNFNKVQLRPLEMIFKDNYSYLKSD